MSETTTKVGGPGAGGPGALDETEGSRSILTYIIGVIILMILGYLIFKGITFLRKSGTTVKEAVPTAAVSVTMEATVEETLVSENKFLIKSLAGYTTLTYIPETEFVTEDGVKSNAFGVKKGDKLRVEGKPNGKIFEAKKVMILNVGTVLPKITGSVTPTVYKLPGTGITE